MKKYKFGREVNVAAIIEESFEMDAAEMILHLSKNGGYDILILGKMSIGELIETMTKHLEGDEDYEDSGGEHFSDLKSKSVVSDITQYYVYHQVKVKEVK